MKSWATVASGGNQPSPAVQREQPMAARSDVRPPQQTSLQQQQPQQALMQAQSAQFQQQQQQPQQAVAAALNAQSAVATQPQAAPQPNAQQPGAAGVAAAGQRGPTAPNKSVYPLYFGDLRPEVTGQFLNNILKEAGPIESIRVCRDRVTRQSLGYAYVNFRHKEDADKCLEKLNYMQLMGNPLRISRVMRDISQRKNQKGNVFIKGLDKGIDTRTLYKTFQQFGTVLSCKVRENRTGTTNIAFVQFEKEEDAARVIESIHNKFLDGKQVTVEYFVPREARDSPDPEKTFVNLYVKFLAPTVTDEQFEKYFTQFGEISSYKVAREEESGACRGFGFVAFKEHGQAKKALDETNGKVIPDLTAENRSLHVARMQTKVERDRLKEAAYKQHLQDRSKLQHLNFFVKNLDPEVTDEKLTEVFGQFGDVFSACVKRDENGKSRGFGFVCFRDKEAAQRAVEEMNNRDSVLGKKPLYMNLFVPRQDRERQRLQQPYDATRFPPYLPMYLMPAMSHYGGFPPHGGRGAHPGGLSAPGGGRGGYGQFGGRGGMGGRGMSWAPFGQMPMPPYMADYYPQQTAAVGLEAPAADASAEQPGTQPSELMQHLSIMAPDERRQRLGDHFYPLIEERISKRTDVPADEHSKIASKVTGMLIDLDLKEIVSMMVHDNVTELDNNVNTAVQMILNPNSAS